MKSINICAYYHDHVGFLIVFLTVQETFWVTFELLKITLIISWESFRLMIPDKPSLPGYYQVSMRNSLVHQTVFINNWIWNKTCVKISKIKRNIEIELKYTFLFQNEQILSHIVFLVYRLLLLITGRLPAGRGRMKAWLLNTSKVSFSNFMLIAPFKLCNSLIMPYKEDWLS